MLKKLLQPSNWKKTYYYLKKNGFRAAVMAALERLEKSENDSYQYIPPTEEELKSQRELVKDAPICFSILVPVYRTPERYFREMLQSVLDQSYPNWELLLGDASPEECAGADDLDTAAVETGKVQVDKKNAAEEKSEAIKQASKSETGLSHNNPLKKIVEEVNDTRVKYIKIAENKGISANTNVVLEAAAGDYIGLLDHDDVLTPDALFHMYQEIVESGLEKCPADATKTDKRVVHVEGNQKKSTPKYLAKLIYSDEDKGDGELEHFYDVNHKPAFDQDYLWSNNYICHFTVMEAGLMKGLRFRPEFDGAQDYDIILRAVRSLLTDSQGIYSCESLPDHSQVRNIPKVLYHWRCHTDSTAVNPQSKLYAYEAGKRALEEDLKVRNIKATVSHSKHLGFYQVTYEDIFRDRPEVAMVVGPVYAKGRVIGGARNQEDCLLYGGLKKGFSGGHLHKAAVWQQCYAGDFTHALLRDDMFEDFKKNLTTQQRDSLRMAWANYVHAQNMLILYCPHME